MKLICPLCAHEHLEKIADTVRFERKADVWRCRGCTLVFLDQKSFTFPDDFYESAYHQTYLTHVEPSALDPQAYYEKMTKTVKPWRDRICNLLTGDETVLDFGCSAGHLLMGIQDRACKVYGHDLNKKELEFCRERLGLDVSDQPLHERFAEGTFDLITMIFVLEHIADPVGLLKYLAKFLKPGGRIAILVPSVRDALVNFYELPVYRRFYYCIEHLFYYSPTTLGMLLDKAGLRGKVETLQEYPITNHLNWGYRQKPADVLSSRRIVPDISLQEAEDLEAWESFWESVDASYREFLIGRGFGDRLWCIAQQEG